MTFGLKDIAYFMLLAGSIAGMWTMFQARIKNVEKAQQTTKGILFKPNGELALITTERCGEKTSIMQRALDKSDANYAEIKQELNELSKNVLIIMIHLNIDVDKVKQTKGVKNG